MQAFTNSYRSAPAEVTTPSPIKDLLQNRILTSLKSAILLLIYALKFLLTNERACLLNKVLSLLVMMLLVTDITRQPPSILPVTLPELLPLQLHFKTFCYEFCLSLFCTPVFSSFLSVVLEISPFLELIFD
jgi:hypothetical protein